MNTVTALRTKDLAEILNVSTHLIYKIVKEHDLKCTAIRNMKLLPPETVRYILEKRGYIYPPKNKPIVINVFGMKGGIGKTSIATAISEGASRLGFHVLAIDLDMQGNLTQSFGRKEHGQNVLCDVIKEKSTITDIIKQVHPFLDIVPSSLENSSIETILSGQTINYTGYFNNIFSPLFRNYDIIVIDCPPTINKITACAACFADLNLIPVNADIDSFDGVSITVSEIERLEKTFIDRGLHINYKIVFNKYDAREKLSLWVMGKIAEHKKLKNNLLPVVIRTDTTFKNKKANNEHVFDARKSTAKEDCFNLISEITGINKWLEDKREHSNSVQLKEVDTA